MITVNTELGTIKVAKSVIGNIIMDVIDSFDGKVIISNSKGKIPNQLATKIAPKTEFDEMGITLTEEGYMNIELYVILKFGASIKDTTGRIIEDIRRNLQETAGLEVNEIKVTVKGTMSRHIAPRHIEVKG